MSKIATTHSRRIAEAIDAMTADQLADFERRVFRTAWQAGLDLEKSRGNGRTRGTYQLYEGPLMVAGNAETGYGLNLPEVVVCLAAHYVEREVFEWVVE